MTYRRDVVNPEYTSPGDPELRRAFYELMDVSYSEAASALRSKGFKIAKWVLDGCYTKIRAELKAYNSILANLNYYIRQREAELSILLAEIQDSISDLQQKLDSGEEMLDMDGNPIDIQSQISSLQSRADDLLSQLELLRNPREVTDRDKLNALGPLKPFDPDLYETLASDLDNFGDNIRSALFDLQEQMASAEHELEIKQSALEEDEEIPKDDPVLVKAKRLREIVDILASALRIRGTGDLRPGVLKLLKPDWACLPFWEGE